MKTTARRETLRPKGRPLAPPPASLKDFCLGQSPALDSPPLATMAPAFRPLGSRKR